MDPFCGGRYLAGGEWQLWGPDRAVVIASRG
jgi:hypothetical protein